MKKVMLLLAVLCMCLTGCNNDPYKNERKMVQQGITKKVWCESCSACEKDSSLNCTLENGVYTAECTNIKCDYYVRVQLIEDNTVSTNAKN